MARKKTYEEVKAYIESQGYELLSKEYKNAKSPLKVRLMETGVEYTTNYGRLHYGARPERKLVKYTYNEVKDYIETCGYKLLSEEYINTDSILNILDTNNGNVLRKSFYHFKMGQRGSHRYSDTRNNFNKLLEKHNCEIVGGDYEGHNSIIRVLNKNIGEYFTTTPDNFNANTLNKFVHTHTNQDIRDTLEYAGFKVLGNIRKSKKIPMIDTSSGLYIEMSFRDFIYRSNKGYVHRSSKESTGEYYISKILSSLNIMFKREFVVIIAGKTHRFDFYIPTLDTYIEYDGIQHYQEVPFFNNKTSFIERRNMDSIKDRYCSSKGSKMIRVPYTEDTYSKIYRYLLDRLKVPTITECEEKLVKPTPVVEYYLAHSLEDTLSKYKYITKDRINRQFKGYYGYNKQDYVRLKTGQYYMNHTFKQSRDYLGYWDPRGAFKEVYGMSKRKYIKHEEDKRKSIITLNNHLKMLLKKKQMIRYLEDHSIWATNKVFHTNTASRLLTGYQKNMANRHKGAINFYITHTKRETNSKFGVCITEVFKSYYGMTKTQYLKLHPEVLDKTNK